MTFFPTTTTTTTTRKNVIDLSAFSCDDDSDSYSVQSDFYGYISKNITDKIKKDIFYIKNRSVIKETLFTPKKKIVIKRFSNNVRRKIMIDLFNKQEKIAIVRELIQYFNKYKFLNSNSQYEYIRLAYKYNKSKIIKSLHIDDVNKIKYVNINNSNKHIVLIATAVRNRHLRRQRAQRSNINQCLDFINNFNKDYVNPFLVLKIQEGEVDSVDECYEALDDVPTTSQNYRRRKMYTQYITHKNSIKLDKPYVEVKAPTRDPILVKKIKDIIRYLANLRKPERYREDIEMEELEHGSFPSQWVDVPLEPQPEMMEPAEVVQQQEAGPVVLNALQEDQVDLTTESVPDNFWIENATSDILVTQQHATSMEIMVKNFSWSSNDNVGKSLFTLDLPVNAIANNMTHPAAMYFGQYAYWHGDIKIRIHLNTTPFHIGKLIFSWYYSQRFDDNANYRDNIASSVLLPNVCFNASVGNDVVLTIPYKNYRSMLPTVQKITDSLALYLGTLRCHVFNPLSINSATQVDGYVYVSFINSKFTGIKPRQTVQPEMLPMKSLVKAAEKTLTLVDRVTNMDKPSIIQPPVMYTPQFTDSFASGTNDVNNIHPLRLDPSGQTQHPLGSSTQNSETNINSIVRQWGLLRTLNWKTSNNVGSSLLTLPVSPELPFSEYFTITYSRAGKSYTAAVLPPMSVLASINAFNRGSIEYKFEFISSRYHTGALIASFTPIISNVSFETAKQSYHATLDIGNINEYIFKVPYINERPYNPRYNREISNNIDPILAPIGELNLFVMNQLRYISGTTDHIFINVYVRAGDDFEVAVPVSPLYSINFDGFPSSQAIYVSPQQITKNLGVATWRYFDSIQSKVLVGKYDTGDDEIIQFPTAEFFTVYEAEWLNGARQTSSIVAQYMDNSGNLVSGNVNLTFKFMTLFSVNNDGNKYKYGLFFNDQQLAIQYVDTHRSISNGSIQNSPSIRQWNSKFRDQTKYYFGKTDVYGNWTGSAADFRYRKVYPVVNAEINEVMADPTISTLKSLNAGKRMFGEQFNDLKDYCRRYQPYCESSVNLDKSKVGIVMRIPITPVGLNISKVANSALLNIIGEGMIPFICSAFRFYRGGLRFKIIISDINSLDSKPGDQVVYIQHKPDIIINNRNIKITSVAINSKQQLFQTGYAYTAVSTSVNNNITIETPCYIPTNLLMLQKPKFSIQSEIMHYMMGALDLYFTGTKESGDIHVSIHYSFADDMDLSCFVGFPPVLPIAEAFQDSFEVIQPEAGEEQPSGSQLVVKLPEKQPVAQGMKSYVVNKVSGIFKEEISTNVKQTIREEFGVQRVDTTSADSMWSIVKDIVKKYGEEHQHIIISCFTNIIHCINNPTISTLVISILSFMAHFGIPIYHKLQQFTSWITSLFSSAPRPESGDDDKTEISSMESCKGSIISSIVEASLELFGKGKDFLTNLSIPNFSSQLFTNIRFGCLTINSVIALFKNLFTVVPAILEWLGKLINPKAWYRWLFFNESSFIKRWVRDVEMVTDPNNRVAINSQVRYNYHIQLLVIVGRDLMVKQNKMVKAANFDYIKSLNTKLNTLYNEIALSNISSSNIGIEPFCICVQGNSQVGKTYMTKSISSACLRAINYETFDNLFYTRPPTTKHWDGVQNEPICIYDDFAHIKTEENLSQLLGEFILLKSKATFMPPRAHLQDKGRKYNPLIIAMTMNESHPNFENVCANSMAWQNRRDILIHAEFVAPSTYPNATRVQDLPEEEIEKMLHAKFSIYKYNSTMPSADLTEKLRVSVPKVCPNTGEILIVNMKLQMIETIYMNINQIKWYVAEKFKVAYEKIKREYLKDIELAKSFYPASDKSFEVNLQDYRKFIIATRKNLNATEQHSIDMAQRMTEIITCPKCKQNCNCVCDTLIFNTASVGLISAENQPEINDEENPMDNNEIESYEDMLRLIKQAARSQSAFDIAYVTIKLMDQKFDFLNTYHTTCLKNDFSNSFRLGYAKKDLAKLMAYPCPHTLLLYLGAKYTSYTIDYEEFVNKDTVYHLMYNERDYPLDPRECNTCKRYFDNKLLNMEKYVTMVRLIISEQQIYLPEIPEWLAVNDKRIKSEVTRYMKKMQQQKEEFNKEIEIYVSHKSWLGEKAHRIYTSTKPMLMFMVAVFSIHCLFGSVHYMASRKQMEDAKREGLKKLNDAKAALLKTHEITDECVANNCTVCKPEMAYDQHRLPTMKRKVEVHAKSAVPEMAADLRSSIDRRLRRNYFFLVAITPYQTEVIARCLGITGMAFICIDHYIDKIRSLPLDTVLEIRTDNYVRSLYMSDLKFTKLQNSALLIGLLPRQFPMFTNIVNLFVSASTVPNITKDAKLYVLDIPNRLNKIENYDVTWYHNLISLHADTLHVPNIVSEQARGTMIDWYWSYQTSGKGLCGSVLISDMNLVSPIIGIHVAGEVAGGRGYAEVICKDTIEAILAQMQQSVIDTEVEGQMFDDMYIPIVKDPKAFKATFEGDFSFIGVVPSKFAYNSPSKSKNVHSLCYNKITESTYDTPHLSPKDPRFEGSPMVKGCAYHAQPPCDFPDDIMDIVYDDVKNLILAKVQPLRHNVGCLTVEQAICGIPQIPGYDAMEFDTSEGFPFSSVRPRGAKDKKWLFELDTNENGYVLNNINGKLSKVMQLKHKQRLEGIVPMTIFIDCLKDLKLPKEKCHKTRVFSVSPVDFTIQFRQYFYDFTIAFQKSMLNVESAVGMNVDSYEWHDMVQQLLENSTKFVCGDYSKFGPRLMSKCVLATFDIIIEWYKLNGNRSLQDAQIRKIMAYETSHARHLMFNMVYEVLCGAPSGCPITTILNNCVNMMYIRASYLTIIRKNSLMLSSNITDINNLFSSSLISFRKYVKVFFYGDDLIMTVNEDILPFFNAQTMSIFFAEYDIVFTDALKTGGISLSTSVFDRETSFLKRNIRRHDKRPAYIAAMDKRAIEETCNWVFQGHEEPEASIIACESMLLNAYGHGEQYYMQLREKVFSFWREYGEYPRIPTWDEVDWRIFDGVKPTSV